jgi:hypothetical protein
MIVYNVLTSIIVDELTTVRVELDIDDLLAFEVDGVQRVEIKTRHRVRPEVFHGADEPDVTDDGIIKI